MYRPDGKNVALTMNVPAKSGFMTTKGNVVHINGTEINTYKSDGYYYCGQGYAHSAAGYDAGDNINITQVVGWH